MTHPLDPRIRSLLRQAGRVAEMGKRSAAEKLYRELIAESPNVADAWVGLGDTLRDPQEKESAYQHALELDPDNEGAQQALLALSNPPQPAKDGMAQANGESSEAEPVVIATREADLISAEEAVVAEAAPTGTVTAPRVSEDNELLYCANHPNRKTNLRCNRCGKPICDRCARHTPVGYRCRECVREQEESFFSATPVHYLLAAMITLPIALLVGFLAPNLTYWVIFVAAGAGTIIGRIVFRLIGRRRGRWLPHLVAGLVALGGLIWLLVPLVSLFLGGAFSLSFIWSLLYAAIAAPSAFYQMR
jgi:hypothetical protein